MISDGCNNTPLTYLLGTPYWEYSIDPLVWDKINTYKYILYYIAYKLLPSLSLLHPYLP